MSDESKPDNPVVGSINQLTTTGKPADLLDATAHGLSLIEKACNTSAVPPKQPYVPVTSPTAITDMLFQEYGQVSWCPNCNSVQPPKTLFGIAAHHRQGIEKIVAHAIIIYQAEIDKAGVKIG